MTETDRTNQQMTLKDGRKLGYAEFGHPDGDPVFFFHGFPGSRLDWLMLDSGDIAIDLEARIIAPDRPGMGLSDFQSGRELLDWPDDVLQLAGALGLDKFAVLGVSGGGPYGDVCAFKIPEQLTATAIVSGMGPADAPGSKDGSSWIFPGKPSLLRRLYLMFMTLGFKDRERMVSQIKGSSTGADEALMNAHPEVAEGVFEAWQQAFLQGVGGVNHEAGLYTRPWGFRLQDIYVPILLWYGGQEDKNVLSSVGEFVADSIPNCETTYMPDEGHFSLIYHHLRDILGQLVD